MNQLETWSIKRNYWYKYRIVGTEDVNIHWDHENLEEFFFEL